MNLSLQGDIDLVTTFFVPRSVTRRSSDPPDLHPRRHPITVQTLLPSPGNWHERNKRHSRSLILTSKEALGFLLIAPFMAVYISYSFFIFLHRSTFDRIPSRSSFRFVLVHAARSRGVSFIVQKRNRGFSVVNRVWFASIRIATTRGSR